MNDPLAATDPAVSCSVLASAGTGKTWQLVARLTRLLLHGVQLDSILAITFTRKAAGEMQQRLNERLHQLLEADDSDLDRQLAAIGEAPDAQLRQRARQLFEDTLRSEQRLRASTFHSFCQDLLRRFPLEAGLPPGFELAEQTGLLIDEAWDALFAEVTAAPEQPLAVALTTLFDSLGSLYATRQALLSFVHHRSDWWAWTLDDREPATAATARLAERLEIRAQVASGDSLVSATARAELSEFRALLERHANQGNRGHADRLGELLSAAPPPEDMLAALLPVFFTGGGEPRKRKASKAQCKTMGEAGQQRFLQLHALFCERIAAVLEQRNRRFTLETNRAWYLAGERLLQHYQRIKRERRLLDFADLEWHAYRLLNHPEHASWIQYKLDQRIDHLLIDEFQDTNPTQWRLVLPLLQEIAAGGERQRSLFIVGDAKQSIYRFRRGDPRLLTCAADWMAHHLHARRVNLDRSWRSSPLIMQCVNTVFQHPAMQGLLEEFQPHSTHRENYWGRVEVWPLTEADPEPDSDAPPGKLRDPTQRPRPFYRDRRHYREGEAIASRIRQLVEDGIADYSDVLILMRSRTHLGEYEAALRDRHIPYISLDRGTLLQSLEIRDLEALLMVLITPQDNLSLAQALRSPVFAVGDPSLELLAAEHSGSWYDRLQAVAPRLEGDHELARAARLLGEWHQLAGRMPIHDLLERIFHQSNLVARFLAAFPAAEHARLRANLTRFVELALEVDAGRYPTLPRFLERLGQLRTLDKEGPSQATPQSTDSRRVRLLTIHAAKGLEAPVVFIADSAHNSTGQQGASTLVSWPAERDRPEDFLLLARRDQRDSISQQCYEREQQEERRESANLLYVAMTRARHMLVISGCRPRRSSREPAWHQQLATALCGDEAPREPWVKSWLKPAVRPSATTTGAPVKPPDPRLRAPITVPAVWQEIAPSRSLAAADVQPGDADGVLRGLVIHRLLQLGADQPRPGDLRDRLLAQVSGEHQLGRDDTRLRDWWQEVHQVLTAEHLAWLMRPPQGVTSYNEVPVQFRREARTVFGVVDRLVVNAGRVQVVDYKSHRLEDAGDRARLVETYRPQMQLYREAVQRLWPQCTVTCYLLLTATAGLIEVD